MQNLSNLQEIYLKIFQQQRLDSNTKFEYFPNLQKLSMISSNIQFISSSAFDGKLANLRKLEVTHNPSVSPFPVHAINNLRALTSLTWTFNDMDQISSQMFSQLTNLVELDFSQNKINSLADNWYTGITSKLEFLTLQANNLISTASIQSMSIPDWPKLHQLDLDVNNLQDFPSGFFSKMPNLAYLGLGSNKLTTIKSTYFTGLVNMHSLDFHENLIFSVESGALAQMPLLRSLNLENQNVAALHFTQGSISGAESIEQLYLINTPVMQNKIWGAIQKMTNLTELHLTNTGISKIPDFVFQNHKRLVLLDVGGNTLYSVSQAMFHGLAGSLESLSLSNTGIQTINECVFKDFYKLKTIHLGQNSLKCDCTLKWLYDWIQDSNEPFIESIVHAVCSAPTFLKDKNMANINRNQLVCDSGYVPDLCQVFTTTITVSTTSTDVMSTATTTPSTSTTMPSTTTSTPLPEVSVSISTIGSTYITVSWDVTGDTSNLLQFTVSYQKLGELNPMTYIVPMDKGALLNDYRIDGLVPESTYLICVDATIQSSKPVVSCVTKSTARETVVNPFG
ncbi:hypothetical protein FSP39_024954 [Pinctada imbricata]|uniref:Fibronectin type-III domain-containing protein n=1 Tax=Pinctada imbricata TaxID=66713 RepID=A0AA89C8R0_PINIB|nr:hypothetical protein FSP39_024954 [Pinctada imbricata]